jgi:hypothetical protein
MLFLFGQLRRRKARYLQCPICAERRIPLRRLRGADRICFGRIDLALHPPPEAGSAPTSVRMKNDCHQLRSLHGRICFMIASKASSAVAASAAKFPTLGSLFRYRRGTSDRHDVVVDPLDDVEHRRRQDVFQQLGEANRALRQTVQSVALRWHLHLT